MYENFFPETDEPEYKIEVKDVGNLALIAGAFDHFGLQSVIDSHIGKKGSHVQVNAGAIVKAMVCQLLNAPYQSLNGTSEYFKRRPVSTLLRDPELTAGALNRAVLARTLDDIFECGCEKLFVLCSLKISKKLGLKVTSVHIDSTSFHYDGQSRLEELCNVVLNLGYSRDHHPELNQVISVILCDELSRIPIFQKTVSGNVNDNKSFFEMVRDDLPLLKEQFRQLHYLTGDSALCTGKILKEAVAKGLEVVTRVPDKCTIAKRCINETEYSELKSIDPEDPTCLTKAKWCGDAEIDGVKVKLLLVNNEAMRSKKEVTVRKHADKEKEELESKLKKLATNPCKCQADAEKCIQELQKKLKFCRLSDISYEEVLKHSSRGRPSKNDSKVVAAVKASATVTINEEILSQKVENELRYVIATTDLKRNWTAAELISVYKKQSVIERSWRFMKCKKLMVDALFLQKPSRITALMWLMTLALLVYSATEYKIRKAMEENNLTIPTPDHHKTTSRPTLQRLFQYIANASIHLTIIRQLDQFKIVGLTRELKDLINALGRDWATYFLSTTYRAEPGEDF
ncbi:MAG: IS1634 family transposase [Succinatimonas sp.]|nr:IS1634 family transposase [Succinatimonas sp.]